MSKIVLKATIPVAAYANIQPEIEVEADTYEEALEIAQTRLANIWNHYCEPGKQLPIYGKKLEAYVGGEIYYDEASHTYTNKAGEVYLSGSVYADSFRKPFEKELISKAMAKKIGANPQDIMDMWDLKGQVSRDFGSAIHAGLQLYEQYGPLCKALGKTTHLHEHPILKQAVESFYDAHKGEEAMSEVLIVDNIARHAGQIDRLLITGDQTCRVQDFKTNEDVTKELEYYWKQLEFYGHIMEADGWTVEGYDIFHYNGSWHDYTK